jgi:hypothetical protein
MKPLDGISALTLILIASFAIDRVTTWSLLVLSAFGVAPDVSEDGRAADPRSARKYKLLYFVFSALQATLVVWLADLRFLSALGVESTKGQVA